MGEQEPAGKPFEISKQEVQGAWLKVKANKGAPGVDEQSIEDFEAGLKGNLYKIWNRMSSGSYFPPQGHGKVAFMQPEAALACAAGRGGGDGWPLLCCPGRPGAGD